MRTYTYRTAHAEMLRKRQDWFEKFDSPAVALGWVPAGHLPSVDEAKKRLDHLRENGPAPYAFTFRALFPGDAEQVASVDLSAFAHCSSV